MIYLAADWHGYKTMKYVMEYLDNIDTKYTNLWATSADAVVTLQDMIPAVADKITDDTALGILSCGTGVWVEVGANKFGHIRACLATEPKIATWGVAYDKCNILCLPGWETSQGQIHAILDAWFSAEYDGSERRLKMFEVFSGWH